MCYVGKATKIFIFIVTVLVVIGLLLGFGLLRHALQKTHKCSGDSCHSYSSSPVAVPFPNPLSVPPTPPNPNPSPDPGTSNQPSPPNPNPSLSPPPPYSNLSPPPPYSDPSPPPPSPPLPSMAAPPSNLPTPALVTPGPVHDIGQCGLTLWAVPGSGFSLTVDLISSIWSIFFAAVITNLW
ncbi:sulfated surface glycoprotein 185-like [Carya illinoinensis]|uniref:sulfated surface glycoprotein 185-like n=1 Tax=Carya illinoinensis TaxID=32201 RepID=UPI001C71F2C0|nr:sulfated surface glycoprotein 185-like [Carya illinoinensis]